MAAQMRCTVSSLPFGHVVRVFGEVDLATAPALAEVLAQVASARLERLFEITGIGVLFGKEPCALDA